MARPLRVCVPGALYHVIARGNNRAAIFIDDGDRRAFKRTLATVISRYTWACHAYCLMENHYHAVVETPLANLPRGMRQLNGTYAQWFNRRHDRSGHLFEARYRAILVEKQSHLLEICRYVVLNPVRAGLCNDPGDWPWSSYQATAGETAAEPFLSIDALLGQFGVTAREARKRYRDFLFEGIDGPKPVVRGGRLGSESFLREDFGLEEPDAEVPREQWLPSRPSLGEIFAADSRPVRTAYRRYGYRLREIAAHLGCHYATVSRRLRREEALLDCKT